VYYPELNVDSFLQIRFHNEMAKSQLPREILPLLFAAIDSISLLGTLAQVSQLWYTVICSEDGLWERFLPDRKRTDLNRTARREVYLKTRVCLPECWKAKIEQGYCLESARSAQSVVLGSGDAYASMVVIGGDGVGKSASTMQFAQRKFLGLYSL
jgi:hypothetical protein